MTHHRNEHRDGVGPMDKAAEALGGMVGTMKAKMGAMSESAFVANASRGDVYEIEAGRIAQQRAHSAEVRQLAERMIRDHTDSSTRLMAALRRHGDTGLLNEVSGELDAHRSTMIEHLREARDDQFDAVYIDQQKKAHRETLALFEGFDSSDEHPELVQYARAMLPVLREHRTMVERIEGSGTLRS